jgi:hypothetical protein
LNQRRRAARRFYSVVIAGLDPAIPIRRAMRS